MAAGSKVTPNSSDRQTQRRQRGAGLMGDIGDECLGQAAVAVQARH